MLRYIKYDKDQIGLINECLNKYVSLIKDILNHHKINEEDLKKGDIQEIYNKPLNKRYIVIYNRFCYEIQIILKNDNISFKALPNKDFFNQLGKKL